MDAKWTWSRMACAGAFAAGALVCMRHSRKVLSARRRFQVLLQDAVAHGDGRVVVTGATSGIGRELACQFSRHPAVAVLVGCRDVAAADRLFKQNPRIQVAPLDLADFDSVQRFAERAHEFLGTSTPGDQGPLRMFVNNASVMKPLSAEDMDAGLDLTWRTNFLGPYLLTELIGMLRTGGHDRMRVVHVSSRLEKRSGFNEDMLVRLENSEVGPKTYIDSKRALMLWTAARAQSLAEEKGVCCHAATPGMVDTQLGRHSVRPWLWPLTKPLRVLLLRPAAVGALSVAAAGLRPEATLCFGRYLDGEVELEDLVVERRGERELADKLIAWASSATALGKRALGKEQ